MADRTLVEQIVRFAFLLRLTSLLLAVLVPGETLRSPTALSAFLFITLTSALGLYATEGLTRRVAGHPILLVLDVLAASGIAVALGSQSPIVLYSLSTAVLIGILLKPGVGGLVLAILVSVYLLVVIVEDDNLSAMAALIIPITYVVVGAMGSLMRTLHESAMTEAAKARRLSDDASRERERAHLAREMHDSVAKSLHGIGLAAAALPAWAEKDPASVPAMARELQAAAEEASQDARAILVGLRTDTDDRTLAQLMRALADDLTGGGLTTDLAVEGVGDCDHAIKRELFAIAAESVENVRRHSRATAVALQCRGDYDAITLTIRDDGVGFDVGEVPEERYGLVGMRERADSIGAELTLTSATGQGTTVVVRAPRTAYGEAT